MFELMKVIWEDNIKKRGGKVVAFGLLKRNGKVYTVIIPNTKTPLFVNKLNLIALFIQVVITVMICWT